MEPFSQQTPPQTPQPGYYPAPNAFGQPGYPGYPAPQTPYQPNQPGAPGNYPQPAYPAQGQPGFVPGSQPPRSNRVGIWIIVIVAAVILLSGGGIAVFAIVQAQNSPTATLQRFCDGLTHLNAEEVYNTLSTQYQQTVTLTILQRSFDDARNTGGAIESCVVDSVQQDGATASATITVVSKDNRDTPSQSSTSSVELTQENGQWKINRISTLL